MPTDQDFHELCELIHSASGIKLDEGKQQLVKSRLHGRILEAGVANLTEYVRALKADTTGNETSMLVDLISTNVTSFFREQHHFEHLVKVAWQEKLDHGRPEVMRIWSSACSSGEEPYSIALSLAQELGEEHLGRFLILATDISTRMVAHADRGVYEDRTTATVPTLLRREWFQPEGPGEVRVDRRLRARVRARHLNLMGPWPMKRPFDVIFCRNVLIYFDTPTRQRLIDRFYRQLQPGGYLYIGHSESLSQLQHGFEYTGPTIYRKPRSELS